MNWADKMMFWILRVATGGAGLCVYFSFAFLLIYVLFTMGGWIGFTTGFLAFFILLFFANRTISSIFKFSSWYVKLSGLFK